MAGLEGISWLPSVVLGAILAASIGSVGPSDAQPAPAGGAIRGRILDEHGKPIDALRVSIGSLVVTDAEARLIALPPAVRTNADGMFEARDVPPGDWYVQVEQDVLLRPTGSENEPDHPLTYFPGVTDPRRARPVTVVSGGTATADLVVTSIPVFEMALRLAPLDALRSSRLELFLNGDEAGRPRVLAPRDAEADGTVRFKRLRPGRYFVWARAFVNDRALVAWRRVDLGSRDEAIEMPLVPAGRLSGRVVGADAAVVSGARVVATLVDDGRAIDYREPDSTEVLADGRFAIGGVFGERRLRVIGLPEGWRVRAIRAGGREISDPLVVREGELIDEIEVIVGR